MNNKKGRVLILMVCALTIITGVVTSATVLAQVYPPVDPAFDQSTMLLALVESGSAENETLSILVLASPSEIQTGKESEIRAIISNVADRRVEDISLTVIAPRGWTVKTLVTPQSSLNVGESTHAVFDLSPDTKAQRGEYCISVKANYDLGSTYGNVLVNLRKLDVVPTTGEIPISLVKILVPGFLAYALVLAVTHHPIHERSALEVALVSFLFGSTIWFIQGKNPLTVEVTYGDYIVAGIFTVLGGLGTGIVVEFALAIRDWVYDRAHERMQELIQSIGRRISNLRGRAKQTAARRSKQPTTQQ